MMRIPRIKPRVSQYSRVKRIPSYVKVPKYEVQKPSSTAMFQNRGTGWRKGLKSYAKKEARKVYNTVTPTLKREAAKAIDLPIGGVESLTQKLAEKVKAPVGTLGRNLSDLKVQLVDQPAIGGTTESTTMFSYRPKRATKTKDTIEYTAVRNKKLTVTNVAGYQQPAARNLAMLEPPKNDVLASNNSYTNFSIRNEFDRMIKARFETPEATQESAERSMVANFHSLTSVMILRAPSQGAIVDVYDLQPKFGIGPGTYSSESLSADHLCPYWCWSSGLSNLETSYVTIDTMDDFNELTVNSDPLESPTFRRTWNIIKKTTIRMTSNSIHRHRFAFNINKSVNWDEMGQASPDGGTCPWLPTQMVVVRGYPTASLLAEAVSVECQQETKLRYSSRLAMTTNVIVYNNNT